MSDDKQESILREIPENPVPEGGVAGFIETGDGTRLRFARFRAAGEPFKGTILLLQGRNEAIEKYFETIGDFSKAGYGVIAFDWRGQGGSTRLVTSRQGYVRRFEHFGDDLDAIISQVALPDGRGPFFIVAHSSGALAAILASPRLANRIERMVLLAPFLEPVGLPVSNVLARRIARLACWLGLGKMALTPAAPAGTAFPFEINRVSRDPKRYERNSKLMREFPELFLGGASAAWVNAAFRAIGTVKSEKFLRNNRIPMLMLAPTEDKVVSATAIEAYARTLRCASFISIDGAYHELAQERNVMREQMLAAVKAFLPGSQYEPAQSMEPDDLLYAEAGKIQKKAKRFGNLHRYIFR
ncbi:alpha/beta hydrolase [Limoniibacter endophyticus]|uniref:Lysophospholipase n=1 Tax=Limoniibacter endophyticus TaxID=1565040 RepID=A0A8J3DPL0_9HYPH|nr:alpha/beta hydrolase [Limoniibacter endophyticus]GHC64097.1 lysophospholipase [Limoniibacter endophyticus]